MLISSLGFWRVDFSRSFLGACSMGNFFEGKRSSA